MQGVLGRRLHTVAMPVQRPLTDQEGLVYQLEWQASHALPHAKPLLAMTGEPHTQMELLSSTTEYDANGLTGLSLAAVHDTPSVFQHPSGCSMMRHDFDSVISR